MGIRNFAMGMLALFIPVYLYKLSYSIPSILGYYIMFYAFAFSFFFLGLYLCKKIGVKHSILISAPVTIGYLILLHTLKSAGWPLFFIALIGGIGDGIFWSSFHIYFATKSDDGSRGKQVSTLNGSIAILGAFAPIAGGAIAGFWSFGTLFIIGSVLFLVSALPLFLTHENKIEVKFNLNQLIEKKHFIDDLPYIGEGIRYGALGVIWPFYIFLVGLNVVLVGFSFTLANVFYVIFNFIMGMVTDSENKIALVRLGAVMHGLSVVVRGFVGNVWSVMFVHSFGGVTAPMLEVPFLSLFYENSSKSKGIIIVIREFYLALGRIFVYSLGIVLFWYTGSFVKSFAPLFIIAGLSCYFQTLMHPLNKPKKKK
ncbi:MFS transporter [Candidatus Woesearchaeota archaeon]|jgi:hypothetical protein|nr:MFS transporter [Candidatus Woesearchaeota archaeon]MBT6518393.1 MFS transporter [Candidatus Woesearchaeota archaeon]MBT7366827.1 MFS transporter [Candidatus Woesearchaeota archaeon]